MHSHIYKQEISRPRLVNLYTTQYLNNNVHLRPLWREENIMWTWAPYGLMWKWRMWEVSGEMEEERGGEEIICETRACDEGHGWGDGFKSAICELFAVIRSYGGLPELCLENDVWLAVAPLLSKTCTSTQALHCVVSAALIWTSLPNDSRGPGEAGNFHCFIKPGLVQMNGIGSVLLWWDYLIDSCWSCYSQTL